MKNIIALKKNICLVPESNEDNLQLAMSLQSELMNLGFILSQECFQAMSKAPVSFITSYYKDAISYLKKAVGADRSYQPFYPNFPKQVMEMSHMELYLNAVMHYWSEGEWTPDTVLKERGFKFEKANFKTINLATEEDFAQIFTNLVSINSSLTKDDKEIVEWFVNNYSGIKLPDVIPFKETLCLLAAKGLNVPVKSTTDVLRIVSHLSGGDISLPHVPKLTIKEVRNNRMRFFFQNLQDSQIKERDSFKFKKFNRRERKFLLGLLEKTNLNVEEMQSHFGRWLRLGEILHPGEFRNKFPKTYVVFNKLRNQEDEKIRTFNGKVNLLFKNDWKAAVDLLSTRPGEFARKLDWMLRTFEPQYVLNRFEKVGDKVSNKVLFELYNHFDARTKKESSRMVMIKGKKSICKVLDVLEPMKESVVDSVKKSVLSILKNKFSKLPELGKIYIDEKLKKVPLPFAMRSINTSVKTYVRGTRIPFNPDAKVIRPFIHWFDEFGYEDLDLSAGFYTKGLKPVTHISYTNLKNEMINSCHSGDIRQKKGACAEYVDIDIKKCLKHKIRYVIVQVHNFQNRPMHTLRDCVFGLMEREHPKANEIFVPKTISNCMQIGNESSSVNVCIIDLKQKEYIWADMENQSRGLANLEANDGKTKEILMGLIHMNKMSVYDLLLLHAGSRGTIVPEEDADVKFLYDEFVSDYIKIASYM